MAYQRKKRAYEQEPQHVPQPQPSLFASPDLETEDADSAYVAPRPAAGPSLETLQRRASQPGFDFGKISIAPTEFAVQRQPVDPSTLSKQEKFSQRFSTVQREPVVSSMSLPPGPLDRRFAAPKRDDGPAHTIAIQRQPVERQVPPKPDLIAQPDRIPGNRSVSDVPLFSQMGRPTGQRVAPVQRQADPNEAVQRAPAGDAGSAGAVNLTPQGSGSPLPKQVTDTFVQSGYPEVKQARVHVDDAATQSIQAKAYTQKNNIVVQSSGANDPKLLGHEATHVVQQSQMALKPDVNGTPINANPALEQNADDNGERVARHEPVSVEGARATGKLATREGAGSKLPVQRHGDGVVQRLIQGRPESNRSRKSAEKFLKQQRFTQAVAKAVVDAAITDKNPVTYADMIRAARLMVQRQVSAAEAIAAALAAVPPAAPVLNLNNNNPIPYNAPVAPLNNVQAPVDFGAAQIDFDAPAPNNHNPIPNAPIAPLNNVQGPVDLGAAQIDFNANIPDHPVQFPNKKTALNPDEWTQHGQPIDFGAAQIKGVEPDEKVENDSPMKPLAYPNKQSDLPKKQKYLQIYQSKDKYFEIQNHEIPDYFKAIYQVHPNPDFLDMTSDKLMRQSKIVQQQKVNPTPHCWATGVDPVRLSGETDSQVGRLLPVVWPENISDKANMVVSRGDTRPPWDDSLQSGFKPWSMVNGETRYSKNLYRHVALSPSPKDSAYVSTTTSTTTSNKFANGGYDYRFESLEGIEVPTIFPAYAEEEELAVPGVIPLGRLDSVKTGKKTLEGKRLQQIIKDKAWDKEISQIWPNCAKSGHNPKMTWKQYLGEKDVKPHLEEKAEKAEKEEKGNEESNKNQGISRAQDDSIERQKLLQAMQQQDFTKRIIDKYGKRAVFQAIAYTQNHSDINESKGAKKRIEDIFDNWINKKANEIEEKVDQEQLGISEDAALMYELAKIAYDPIEGIRKLKEEKEIEEKALALKQNYAQTMLRYIKEKPEILEASENEKFKTYMTSLNDNDLLELINKHRSLESKEFKKFLKQAKKLKSGTAASVCMCLNNYLKFARGR